MKKEFEEVTIKIDKCTANTLLSIDEIVCIKSIYSDILTFGRIIDINKNKIKISFSSGYCVEEYDKENLYYLLPEHV